MAPWLVLLLISLPLLALMATGGGIAAGMALSGWTNRCSPPDEAQAQAFALAPHPGLFGRGWGLALETWWQSWAFLFQGLHMVRRFRFEAPVAGRGPVVFLVPGYLENAGLLWILGRRLRARGFQPVLVDLPSTLLPIEENAATLAAQISSLQRELPELPTAVVAHSMGGLVTRTALHSGALTLTRAIAIGSPFRGTAIARIGFGASARDMTPGSPFMQRHSPAHPGAPVRVLAAVQDNIVGPTWSVVLEGGETRWVPEAVGHVAPLFLSSALNEVCGWLPPADDAQASSLA